MAEGVTRENWYFKQTNCFSVCSQRILIFVKRYNTWLIFKIYSCVKGGHCDYSPPRGPKYATARNKHLLSLLKKWVDLLDYEICCLKAFLTRGDTRNQQPYSTLKWRVSCLLLVAWTKFLEEESFFQFLPETQGWVRNCAASLRRAKLNSVLPNSEYFSHTYVFEWLSDIWRLLFAGKWGCLLLFSNCWTYFI